jgi:hypothetical protein
MSKWTPGKPAELEPKKENKFSLLSAYDDLNKETSGIHLESIFFINNLKNISKLDSQNNFTGLLLTSLKHKR